MLRLLLSARIAYAAVIPLRRPRHRRCRSEQVEVFLRRWSSARRTG